MDGEPLVGYIFGVIGAVVVYWEVVLSVEYALIFRSFVVSSRARTRVYC